MYNNTSETVAINKNFGIIVILQNSMRVNLKKILIEKLTVVDEKVFQLVKCSLKK